MRRLPIACPAATPVEPSAHGPSVICGVLQLSNDGAHAHGFTSRGQVSPLMSGREDTRTVRGFCCGDGGPGVAGYVNCELWKAQRDADAANRKGPGALRDEHAHRPPRT